MPKYVITKQFRDPSGLRLPGEIIELTPSRAAALRDSGLIGAEYIPEPKPEQKLEIKAVPESKNTKDKAKKDEVTRKAGK